MYTKICFKDPEYHVINPISYHLPCSILHPIHRVFTETMRLEGCWDESRMKKQSLRKDFQFMKKNFFVRLITFPLNLIPFAGAALYSAINGTYFPNIY